jgi:fatty acid desaturase
MPLNTHTQGSEFREDVRARRRPLDAQTLSQLTTLNDGRALWSVFTLLAAIAATVAIALAWWNPAVVVVAVVFMATRQQACFVLAHDAAHYRLFSNRRLNDWVGLLLAAPVGISMRSYRVIHRLHHNDLYGATDPDIALHGGYPRGKRYLFKRLLRDLTGVTAPKTYAYFSGAPALNTATDVRRRPEDDTHPSLREAAQRDRRAVLLVQASLLIAASLSGYLLEYLILWILPAVTVLQAVLRFRAILEHGAVRNLESPLTAARTNLGPRWLLALLFPYHVNYHVEHHLYPAIPHYHLPAAHAALKGVGVMDDAEVRSVFDTVSIVFAERAPQPAQEGRQA